MNRLVWGAMFLTFGYNAVNGQVINTFAGTGSSVFSGEGMPATAAGVPNPNKGVFDKSGNFYFPDGQNSNRVRKITPYGVVVTVAGTGVGGFSGDGGLATSAKLNTPGALALDSAENLYIADGQNVRIRKVDKSTGIITTIAGNGTAGYSGDGGLATAASISVPIDVLVDSFGNIFIADGNNFKIRKVDASGIITTYAGTGTNGFSGDGGAASLAELSGPSGLALDDTGNLYIADVGGFGNRVRKINSSGIITTFAGNGTGTYVGDGIPATSASIAPMRICFDKEQNLFVADRYNNRVYKIGVDGILHNIAGTGTPGDTGDGGIATSATLNYPTAVAIDECGNLYISTVGSVAVGGSGRRIRKVTFNSPTASIIGITGVTAAPLGSTVTVNATVSGAGSTYNIKWFNKGVQFATTTVPIVTYMKTQNTDSITARLVPAVVYCYDSSVSGLHIITKSPGGITSAATVEPLLVYPNPATDVLNISGDGSAEIIISDMVGRQLLTHKHSAGISSISIASLPAEVYTVRIIQDGRETLQKLIKQ